MCVSLVLLAGGAAFYIFSNVLGHSGPPVFCRDELASFQVAGVAGGQVVMV